MSAKPRRGRYAQQDDAAEILATALHDLPDNFLMCRDMRHAWEMASDFHVERDVNVRTGNIRRILQCVRCQMQRTERYVQTRYGLEKVGQTYTEPEGYRIHGVPRGVKPSIVVQGEQYQRAMDRLLERQLEEGDPHAS